MTSGIILLIVAIVLIVIIAYLVGIIIRKRNDLLIAGLEERKDNLFKLPINEEIEEVKNLHLIGQSQTTFREWSQKWTDLSLNSFTDLEKQIYQVDNLNDGFHFIKVKNETKNIESQLDLVEEDIAAIREALSILKLQEEKNSARVTHALDLYENLQTAIAANEDKFGSTAPEISKQLKTIESEFSQFVALNSSGDPMEAAAILERAEEHTIALGQISEKIPAIVQKLEDEFPDQLEDLENGYSRLLDEGYNFAETDIEQGFQKIREAIRSNADELVNLDLEHARLENEDIQKKIDKLYDLFEREITAKKQVQKISKVLPGYLSHTQTNNDKLLAEHARLSKKYILGELEAASIKSYQADLADLSASLLPGLEDASLQDQPFSKLEKSLAKAMEEVKAIEAGQLEVYESLTQVEKSEARIRQELDKHVNKLHMIKRFMEKRNLPGIPQEFLTTFFTTSSQLEALMDELSRGRINIESVTKLSEVSTAAIANLEETAYRIVQHAVLTEQLLQYSNRYRSFDSNVQASFERALQVFERNFDYQGSFDEISYALETVEPGVTERFVSSYEKTREVIRF